jgi:hypothetical protein
MNPALPVARSPSLDAQIREAAYFQWLDRGCPLGDEWNDWFAVENRISTLPVPAASRPSDPRGPMPAHGSPAASHDMNGQHLDVTTSHPDRRPGILASGAAQRSRARHQMSRSAPQSPKT